MSARNSVLVFFFVVFCLFPFSSASISDSLSGMLSSSGEVLVVYGDSENLNDLLAVASIVDLFGSGSVVSKKAGEVGDYSGKSLILVGGPCANRISEEITDEVGFNCDDWKFDAGKAVAKSFVDGGEEVIMVAGTTGDDTFKVSESFKRFRSSKILSSSNEAVFDNFVVGQCGNNVCEEGENNVDCSLDCSLGTGEQLTSGMVVQVADISGEWVVYHAFVEDPAGRYDPHYDMKIGDRQVFLQNSNTREVRKIGKGDNPRISGDYVVFMSGGYNSVTQEHEDTHISLYQISTGELSIIASSIDTDDEVRWQQWPEISGDKIIWFENVLVYKGYDIPKSKNQLTLYEISSKKTKKVMGLRYIRDTGFKIHENNIVYEGPKYCKPSNCDPGAEEGDSDIWYHNLDTGKTIQLTEDVEDQRFVDVHGKYIVWLDGRDLSEGGWKIFSYNIETKEEKEVPLDYKGSTSAIYLSHGNVVWTEIVGNNADAYAYNLESGVRTRLSFGKGSEGSDAVDGNNVLWIHSDKKQDLYLSRI